MKSLQGTINFRPALECDLVDIIQIAESTDKFTISDEITEIDEDEVKFWITDSRSIFVVAQYSYNDAEKVVGFAYGTCISPRWFAFEAFAVHPDFRNHGVGKSMYGYLRSICKERDISLIQGLVVDGENSSLQFWINLDFEIGETCIWVEDWLE